MWKFIPSLEKIALRVMFDMSGGQFANEALDRSIRPVFLCALYSTGDLLLNSISPFLRDVSDITRKRPWHDDLKIGEQITLQFRIRIRNHFAFPRLQHETPSSLFLCSSFLRTDYVS